MGLRGTSIECTMQHAAGVTLAVNITYYLIRTTATHITALELTSVN